MRRGRVEQLAARVGPLRGHQVEEAACVPAERRPVEIGVRHQPRMLLAAHAVEADAVHGGMRRAGKPLDQPEVRERNTRLLAVRTREGVAGSQRVVHRYSFITGPDVCDANSG